MRLDDLSKGLTWILRVVLDHDAAILESTHVREFEVDRRVPARLFERTGSDLLWKPRLSKCLADR